MTAGRLLLNQQADGRLVQATRLCHATDLVQGGRRADVGIQAASGCGHEVDRYRRVIS